MNSTDREHKYHALTHASAPIIGWLGGMSFLGPLVMWLAFKNEYPSIERHAKKALNFHITMFIATILSVLLVGVFTLSFAVAVDSGVSTTVVESIDGSEIMMDQVGDMPTSDVDMPIWPMALFTTSIGGLIGLLLFQFIVPIVMAFKAYNGRFNKYPFAFPFFRI